MQSEYFQRAGRNFMEFFMWEMWEMLIEKCVCGKCRNAFKQKHRRSWWPHNFTNENLGHFRTFQDIFTLFSGHQRGKNKDISGQFPRNGQFILSNKSIEA